LRPDRVETSCSRRRAAADDGRCREPRSPIRRETSDRQIAISARCAAAGGAVRSRAESLPRLERKLQVSLDRARKPFVRSRPLAFADLWIWLDPYQLTTKPRRRHRQTRPGV